MEDLIEKINEIKERSKRSLEYLQEKNITLNSCGAGMHIGTIDTCNEILEIINERN